MVNDEISSDHDVNGSEQAEVEETSLRNNATPVGMSTHTNEAVGDHSYVWYGEFHDNSVNSHKFYRVSVNGNNVTRTFGRVQGYSSDWARAPIIDEHATEEDAISSAASIVRAKVRKGYQQKEVEE